MSSLIFSRDSESFAADPNNLNQQQPIQIVLHLADAGEQQHRPVEAEQSQDLDLAELIYNLRVDLGLCISCGMGAKNPARIFRNGARLCASCRYLYYADPNDSKLLK